MGTSKVITAAVFLCVCLGAGAQTRSGDPLDQAEALIQKQQYAQAADQLKVLVAQTPENPQAWFDLGYAQSHLKQNAGAIEAYRKAVQLSPKWFEASLNLGVALARGGDHPGAVAVLKQAVLLKPSSGGPQALSAAWLALADALSPQDPKSALDACAKAEELTPRDPRPFAASGKIHEQLGDTAATEQSYLKAAGLGDQNSVAHLADLYISQKRFPEAETWLRKYLDQNPTAVVRLQLARVLSAESKTAEAIAVLQPATGPGKASIELQNELADLYLADKQYANAATLFSAVVQSNPADAQAHYGLGQALLHQLKYAAAEQELLKAVQQKPGLADAYASLADAARQNKHYDLAIKALDARAHYLPETAATYWLRATSYDSLHAFQLAAENYKLFLTAAAGRFPDQEFQARHRLKAIAPK